VATLIISIITVTILVIGREINERYKYVKETVFILNACGYVAFGASSEGARDPHLAIVSGAKYYITIFL